MASAFAVNKTDINADQPDRQPSKLQVGQVPVQAPVQVPVQTPSQVPVAPLSGTATFINPPSLGRVAASQPGGYLPNTYEFTLVVPENAGNALQAVRITQVDNVETVRFENEASRASLGDRYSSASEIPLANIGGITEEQPGEITIAFERPVPPGSTVTIALTAASNPVFGGVYNFGVTAFPEGQSSSGQFLGFGRINFYGSR